MVVLIPDKDSFILFGWKKNIFKWQTTQQAIMWTIVATYSGLNPMISRLQRQFLYIKPWRNSNWRLAGLKLWHLEPLLRWHPLEGCSLSLRGNRDLIQSLGLGIPTRHMRLQSVKRLAKGLIGAWQGRFQGQKCCFFSSESKVRFFRSPNYLKIDKHFIVDHILRLSCCFCVFFVVLWLGPSLHCIRKIPWF